MKKVIAVAGLSNVGGLAMYDLNDEAALIGYNDETPEWYPIEYHESEDSDEWEPVVMWGKSEVPLNQFMRV